MWHTQNIRLAQVQLLLITCTKYQWNAIKTEGGVHDTNFMGFSYINYMSGADNCNVINVTHTKYTSCTSTVTTYHLYQVSLKCNENWRRSLRHNFMMYEQKIWKKCLNSGADNSNIIHVTHTKYTSCTSTITTYHLYQVSMKCNENWRRSSRHNFMMYEQKIWKNV